MPKEGADPVSGSVPRFFKLACFRRDVLSQGRAFALTCFRKGALRALGRCARWGMLGVRRLFHQGSSGTRTAGDGRDELIVKRAVPKRFLRPPDGSDTFWGHNDLREGEGTQVLGVLLVASCLCFLVQLLAP